MQLTVVVENQTSSQSLLAEWGYSAWLQTEDAVVLLARYGRHSAHAAAQFDSTGTGSQVHHRPGALARSF